MRNLGIFTGVSFHPNNFKKGIVTTAVSDNEFKRALDAVFKGKATHRGRADRPPGHLPDRETHHEVHFDGCITKKEVKGLLLNMNEPARVM